MRPNSVKFVVQENDVTYYAWWTVCRDFTRSNILKKHLGSSYTNQLIIFRNGDAKWGTDINDWHGYGVTLLDRMTNREFSLPDLAKGHRTYGEKVNKLCRTFENSRLSTMSNSQIAKWFRAVIGSYMKLNELGFIPVTSDLDHGVFSGSLKNILEKKKVPRDKLQVYMNTLMTSDKKTLPWQEYLDLLKLAIKYPDLSKIAVSPAFKAHVQKYSWINYGYKGPAWGEREFLSRVDRLISEHKSLKAELRRHGQSLQAIRKRRVALEKKLNLSRDEKRMFGIARAFSSLKSYRVDVRHYFCHASYLLFKELAARFSLPLSWFEYAREDEFFSLLSGKRPGVSNVVGRKVYYSELWEGESFRELTQSELGKLLKKVTLKEEFVHTDELSGQAAFIGKTTGPAKIILSPKDIGKVNKGDILVAVYTDPNLLPAMEKAAAFVTEQGGITSHAAIVAREMKKPCIIGTKIATKVLKDGDIVEVDANRGIVKKLSD